MDDAPPFPPDERPERPDVMGPPEPLEASPIDTTEPATPAPRRRWLPVVGGVVLLLVAGAAAAFFVLRGSDEELFDQIPATADAVGAVYLDPAASQKVNLFRIAERFPDLGSRDELVSETNDLIDETLQEAGLTHEDLDWVGVEVAVWGDFPSPDDMRGALLIDSDDDEGALATVDAVVSTMEEEGAAITSTIHDGVEVWTIDSGGAIAYADSTMILGSDEQAVASTIDAGRGVSDAIETSDDFTASMDELPDGRLMVAYVSLEGVTDMFEETMQRAGAGAGPLDLGGTQGYAMALSVNDRGLVMDFAQINDTSQMSPEMVEALNQPAHDSPVLAMTPADAVAVFAAQSLVEPIEQSLTTLTEEDPAMAADLEEMGITGDGGLLENLNGDLGFEVTPDPDEVAAGAVMFGVDDVASMEALIDDLITEASGAPPRWVETEYRGITLRSIDDPSLPVTYAFVDQVFVVASNPAHLERIVDTAQDGGGIEGDEGFGAATADVDSADTLMFIDVPAALDLVRSEMPPEELEAFDDEAGESLDAIGHVVMGQEGDAERQHVTVFIEIP